MPIRWGNSNVREFHYNMPPINVGKSNSRKNKLSNIQNRRYMKPVPANNTRRQAYRNPNYNPNAAIQQLRLGQQAMSHGVFNHGLNVPERYSTGNNAVLGAQKLHNNLYGKKTPSTPESTREENVWTPPLSPPLAETPPLNTPYVNMNNWRNKTNKNNKKRVLKGANTRNNIWSNINL